ncbi:MAG: hypothetical protein IPM29_27565 [Planctomycetes bacterium]|nr:hypothetical protein [Planctomycetota bacterium]
MNELLRTAVRAVAVALACAVAAPAQRPQPTPEELQKKYDEELALPFVQKGNWIVDYDEARARARREGKLIFAYFSRSYAY